MARAYAQKVQTQAKEFGSTYILHDTWAELPMRSGGTVKVDLEDLEYLKAWFWRVNDRGYAKRDESLGTGKKRAVRMHRAVLKRSLGRDLVADEQVDHINGDRLDNRRCNLRLATLSENSRNTRRTRRVARYRGTFRAHSTQDHYCVKVMCSGISYYLGTFESEDEAAWMYDQWALALHGDFASLNFTYEAVA